MGKLEEYLAGKGRNTDELQMVPNIRPAESMELPPIEIDVPYTGPSASNIAATQMPDEDSLSESRVDQIKRIYSPQYQPQPQQQPQQQMMPVPEIDMKGIRDQASSMMPEQGWADILPYLAPLAVEALMATRGETGGESFGISGNALMGEVGNRQKRQQGLEDKLLDMQKARMVASNKSPSRRFQSQNIVDKDTNEIIKVNFDTSTGEYFSPDGRRLNSDRIRSGYSVIPEEYDRRTGVRVAAEKEKGDYFGRGVGVDPETGLLAKNRMGELIPLQKSDGSLNPKLQKDLEKLTSKFTTTDVYKKSTAALGAAKNIDGLLKSAAEGNSAAAESAKTQLARMSGDVGALSDSDISRYGGSPALKVVARRFANLQKTGGTLLPEDVVQLRKIARIYEKANRERLQKAIGGLDSTFVGTYGGPKGEVEKYMRGFAPDLYEPKVSPEKKKPSFEEWKKLKGMK